MLVQLVNAFHRKAASAVDLGLWALGWNEGLENLRLEGAHHHLRAIGARIVLHISSDRFN